MKIKYLGHSSFFIVAEDGLSILTDPYKPGAYGGGITYAPISDEADIVVMSHDHEDHADLESLPNQPLQVRAECQVRGIGFDMVDTFHDDAQGEKRGKNRVICFSVDDIRICHLGDLGHLLSDEQVKEIGTVDILLIPVGGHFTIGPEEAFQVMNQLNPKVCIPMHYKTEKCSFPIEPVDTFLEGKNGVRRSTSSEVIIKKEDLPGECTILCIPHSN